MRVYPIVLCATIISFISEIVLAQRGNVGLGKERAGDPSSPQDPDDAGKEPNLIMVIVDEHSFRTLGCYRELLSHDQAFIWGDGVKVDTPHLDSLAQDGALFKNFYTVAPRK